MCLMVLLQTLRAVERDRMFHLKLAHSQYMSMKCLPVNQKNAVA